MAGFPESVVKSSAKRIAESEEVQKLIAKQAGQMIAAGRGIEVQDLGSIAKVRVQEGLTKLKVNSRDGKLVLGYARTGAEMAGLLGGPSELHLHEGHQISPAAPRMIAEMVVKLQAKEQALSESGITTGRDTPLLAIDVRAEPITAKQEQPQPAAIDTPLIEKDIPFEQRQNDYLRFQAGLIQNRIL